MNLGGVSFIGNKKMYVSASGRNDRSKKKGNNKGKLS